MPGILSEGKPTSEEAIMNGGCGGSNGSCPPVQDSGTIEMCPLHRNSSSPDSELNHSSSTLSTSASSEVEGLEKEGGGEKDETSAIEEEERGNSGVKEGGEKEEEEGGVKEGGEKEEEEGGVKEGGEKEEEEGGVKERGEKEEEEGGVKERGEKEEEEGGVKEGGEKEKESGVKEGGEEKEGCSGTQKDREKQKTKDITTFDLHLQLPGVAQPLDVMLSSQDTVHDLLQFVVDRPGCCYRTCLSVRLRGKRLDNFSDLGAVEGLRNGDTVELVEEPYSQRDVRMHIQRLRDLLSANLFGQSITGSEGLSLSFLSAVTLRDPTDGVRVVEELDLTDPAQLEPPSHCLPHDDPHPPPLTPFYPTNLEGQFKVPECLKAISYSIWNPPPSYRKMKGDLLYLDVTTLEGQELYITACPSGFYLNKSTSREVFDPSPRKVAHLSTHLVGLLSQVSPLFKKNFAQMLKFSEKRHPFEILPVPYSVTPWTAPKPEHKPMSFRIDEGVALKAAPDEQILGQLRDWNEELQSSRELPTDTTAHKLFRDRSLFKVHCEFVQAAKQGAVAVVDGYIPPLNPGEEEKLRIYMWNNIFFSLAFDGRDHFKDIGRDEAAHATAAGDLHGAATLEGYERLYSYGLYTLGTVLVDYRGFRVICQTIIPGLLQQEQNSAVVYGSIDNGKTISCHPKFKELLAKVGTDLHIKEHKLLTEKNEVVELPSSVDVKGIIGTDGRHYILDLYRIFPPDAYYMELPEGSKCRHKLSVLRHELLETFLNYRYMVFLKLAREKACKLGVIQDLQKNLEAQAAKEAQAEKEVERSKLKDGERYREEEGEEKTAGEVGHANRRLGSKTEAQSEEDLAHSPKSEMISTTKQSTSLTNTEQSVDQEQLDDSPVKQEQSDNAPVDQEQSDSAPVKQEQSDSAPVKQEQSDSAPVKQEQSDSAPVKQEQSDSAPVKQEQSDSAPVKQEQPDSAPVKQEQSDSAPVKQEQSDSAPVKQEQSDSAPVKQEQSDSAPVKQEQSDNAPVKQEQSDSAPVKQEQSDSAPVKQEQSDSAPVKQEQSDSAPVKQEQSDSAPVDQEQSDNAPVDQEQSDSAPVKQEQSDSAPVKQEQSDSAPVKQEQSDSAPVKQEQSDSAPVKQEQSDNAAVEQKQSDSILTDQEQLDSISSDHDKSESKTQQDDIPASKDGSISSNQQGSASPPKATMSSLTSEMPSLLILSNGMGASDHDSLLLQALAESGDLCLVDGLQSLAEDKEVGPEIPVVVGEELVDSSAEGVDLGLEDANPYPEVLAALKEAAKEAGSTNSEDFDIQFNVDIFSPGLKQADTEEVLEKDRQIARSAAMFLTHSVVPRLVRDCIQLVVVPVDGEALKQAMHSRGVNMRYLGYVAELAAKRDDLQHLLLLCVSEMIVRIAKRKLRTLLQDTPIHKISEGIAHFLNCLLGETDLEMDEPRKKPKKKKGIRGLNPTVIPHLKLTPKRLWSDIVEEVGWYYQYKLGQSSVSGVCSEFGIQKLSLLRELCRKTGVQLVLQEYDFSAKPTFTEDDIASLQPLVKHTNFRPAEGVARFELAQSNLSSGHLPVALEMFSEALQVFTQVYGPMHVDIANCYKQIARIHHLVNEPMLALTYQHKATLIFERVLGIDHPDTIRAYINLALYCHNTHQVSAGLRLLYRARYLILLVFGEGHPELATCDTNIALLLHSVKDYNHSLVFLMNALKIHERYHGKQSLQTALSHHLIARVQSFLGDFRAALQHEKATYSIYHKKFGAEHERTKESSSCLQGLTEKAVTMQKTIYEMTGKGRTRVNVDLPGSWGDVVSMVNGSDHHPPRHQLRGQRPSHSRPHVVRKRVKQNSKTNSVEKASPD